MDTYILLVDDDPLLRRSLSFNLERAGYQISTANSAEAALDLIQHTAPDLVLLDIGLPGMDGLDALRQLHDQINVPVIFLTARRRELDEVLGLELGADDYITKPFDLDVLLAHIKAVLRRAHHGATAVDAGVPAAVVVGDLQIDPGTHTVLLNGQAIALPPREFDLLYALACRAGQVCSVEDLLTTVWGESYTGESQVVYVHMRWLREKLEVDPHRPTRIVTIRGVGYKLMPQEAVDAEPA